MARSGAVAFMASLLLFLAVYAGAYAAQHEHHADTAKPVAGEGAAAEDLNQTMGAMSMPMPMHDHAGMEGEGAEGPGHHHEMGPHMKMSALRAAQTGDAEKAQQIVETARKAMERYKDSKAAEADGYKIFMPQLKHQKMYHFTNWKYAVEAAFRFNPEHPTSLLYEKVGGDDSDQYRLIGAMYTAPARFTEDQLNERIPLSTAQWHQHVNLCIPPKGHEQEGMPQPGKSVRYGLAGTISTQSECEAAGGTFKPRIFGWMVHMYPWEKSMDEIWSVERQAQGAVASR